ncbi:MAG: GNAT family N-acetyltransferase [Anaerolineales bacterium]|nr:GNAT family N-acetyltransferase [Anaerolineales bacterium]
MPGWRLDTRYQLKILEFPDEISAVEELERIVWPGNETEVVPAHMLLAAIHNGGLIIGAYDTGSHAAASAEPGAPVQIPVGAPLVGFVFGFPGLYFTPDGPNPKHHSHMMGVHPDFRNQGIGFALKRAQWQMVRHQGLDRITWTYDPLLSRNAYLNIARLGAVCNTYLKDFYGQLRDGLNVGVATDRFQVDWWVYSQRVFRRLSRWARPKLELAHFLEAGALLLNPTRLDSSGLLRPPSRSALQDAQARLDAPERDAILLVEIPSDFTALKAANLELAREWRMHTRALFEDLFVRGYLVTDFVYLPGAVARSFYILIHGESTL